MKSYSPKLIIKLWQKSQALASANPKVSNQIKELLKEVRVFSDNTIKRDHLEILLRGIIKEVVQGMKAMDDPNYGDELAVDTSLFSPCCGKPPRDNVGKGNTGTCSKCGQPTKFRRAKKSVEEQGGAAGGPTPP